MGIRHAHTGDTGLHVHVYNPRIYYVYNVHNVYYDSVLLVWHQFASVPVHVCVVCHVLYDVGFARKTIAPKPVLPTTKVDKS